MSVNRISGGGRVLPDQRTDVDHLDRADVIAEIRRVQPDAERILGLRLDDKSDDYLGGFVRAMRQNATTPGARADAVAERADVVAERVDDEGDAAAALTRRVHLDSFPEADREAAGKAFDRRLAARRDPTGRPVRK